MRHVLHHVHARQRVHSQQQDGQNKGYHAYPSPDRRIRILDKIVMVCSVVVPFTTLPQLYTIWVLKNAAGVSALTWILYAFFNIPMFIYGIVHKAKPVATMSGLWMIIDLAVAIGVLANA